MFLQHGRGRRIRRRKVQISDVCHRHRLLPRRQVNQHRGIEFEIGMNRADLHCSRFRNQRGELADLLPSAAARIGLC